MFWKKGSAFKIDAFSLKNRILLSYIIYSILLLSFAFGVSYFAVVKIVSDKNENFLENEINTIKNIIKKSKDENLKPSLAQEVITEAEDNSNKFYVLILFNGKNYIQTPGIDFDNFAIKNNIRSENNLFKLRINKKILLFKTNQFFYKTNNIEIISVIDITQSDGLVEQYKGILLTSFILIFIISFFFINLFSRKGLQPIYDLNFAIKNTDLQSFNINLSSKRKWPTELTQTVDLLNKMMDKIEHSFHRLSSCSNDLAHELRTPLNSIVCQNEVILSKKRDNQDYYDTLLNNLEELRRLSTLIDKLLFIARAESPQNSLERQVYDFSLDLKQLVEYYDEVAEDKRINIHIKGHCIVYADRLLLKRAVGNLISNAIKYSESDSDIVCLMKEDAKYSYILIKDEGIGIPTKDLDLIFDRFYRTDVSRSRKINGFGLGLSIVKSIIDMHDGLINATSQEGKGTEIEIRLKK
ncbi:hypothetical protein CF386_10925 [Paraphotobacterium marinum]|uniref:Sensor protein n=1 Tax=Paraphotobacterium marinum TaxID=1755811 RepID=A0A220VGV4_9GAMM|nr:heavy metal sensor histidine kinase [Paraphotobacterium marinum]ASK79559.1 hypothetical protein CF386_10925 [Paraphotobacterium marinum]